MTEQGGAPYPWQQSAWGSLARRLTRDRLPHAVLLAGPEGLGKAALARHLACALLCQDSSRPEPCAECNGCRLMTAGNHPDFHQLTPEEGSRVIKVDAVRELSHAMGLKSQFGGYRVAIVAPAERMNNSAANSLLKTLEEPPVGTVLVLVAHQPSRLAATIRSRCQVLQVHAPDAADAADWLRQQGNDAAVALLGVAGNAPLAAQALLQQGAAAALDELMDQLSAIASGRLAPVDAAGRWSKDQLGLVTALLLSVMMDLARVQGAGVNSRISRLNELPAALDSEKLHGYLDQLLEQRRLADHPLNAQLVLESLFIRWSEICPREAAHG
ncbi:DNA polymerase III subunit delta' [Aquisalimonas sp. 2447]|uniref:DNA polymerase III subunit delta' n=1 Tax=Aquisalimonas sp. 2447 TaxID=2740807 RepID=UPI001432541D|nr:DNA polymerase III subunit delta' [Aquisalimonas sp. 2447]QIT55502.1 DNA polymerase III subunit delta' [Aquisalimonas sp. 2447]